MNCQDYVWRGRDPKQVSRRWFFEQCGIGLGGMALANLLAEAGSAPHFLGTCAEKIALRKVS